MSLPFTASLRSQSGVLSIGESTEPRLTLRVQIPEIWETVRVDVPADTSVAVLKERVLQRLMPEVEFAEDFLVKLGGWEVLDENATIAEAGAKQGSIFLVSGKRRRPVR